ncbi:serine hydrolase domain-containing protein [Niabella yanshanensis]|uniref:Serine hydrolase domain-containing protein n=1 Tax=Niabella yanshanensis TaxID=577386 RepID=A0ABZ0W0C5_9BACT|nr:serine hydrolase domain-containing protein [Niabella yanshanensis]WQD36708.1 serine hydrolase domain-containing protein [Niabella yanshanensis]
MKSLFVFTLVLLSLAANAQQAGEPIDCFIKKTADSLMTAARLPGIAIGIFKNGKEHYYEVGFADTARKTHFDKTTIFEAGSITKTLTAYIVEAVLKEQGIADTSLIYAYLPDSIQANKALKTITFKSLLNHTSGLSRLASNVPSNSTQPYDNYTIDSLYKYLKTAEVKADSKSNYSNTGVCLAGVLAQRISGKAFQHLLEHYIWGSFKISDAEKEQGYKKSQGYFTTGEVPYWNMDIYYPAGGLKTNCEQMLGYLAAMATPSTTMQKDVVEKVLTPTLDVSENLSIALGWHVLKLQGVPAIYLHNGGTYGFSTFAAFTKEKPAGVIIAINKFNENQYADWLGIEIMKRLATDNNDQRRIKAIP